MSKGLLFSFLLSFFCLEAYYLNEYPSISLNGSGNSVVLWQGYDRNYENLIVEQAALPKDGMWNSPSMISSAGITCLYPKIAMNASGQMIGVWEAKVGNSLSIQAINGSFSSTWGLPTTLTETTGEDTFPNIDIDSAGNGIVLWQEKVNQSYQVKASIYTASLGTWSEQTALSSPSRTMPFPQAVINNTGTVLAAWQYFSGSLNQIQVSWMTIGGGWTLPETISNAAYNTTNVQLAINDAEFAVAVWQRGGSSTLWIEAALCSSTRSWGAPLALSAVDAVSTNPMVAMNHSGKIVVVWQSSSVASDTTQQIQAAIYSAGVWSPVSTLSDPSLKASNPQVAINASGEAIVVWTADHQIQAAALSAENTWSSATTLSDPSQSSLLAQVGIDTEGHGVAVWQTAVESNSQIQAAVYSDGSWGSKTVISN